MIEKLKTTKDIEKYLIENNPDHLIFVNKMNEIIDCVNKLDEFKIMIEKFFLLFNDKKIYNYEEFREKLLNNDI